ncbi:NAD(P)-binding protein [Aspergillus affinis]|uniref:NAD(P)-binding protein n=1 Tax=Aspergillus affinis TaxID=1070780 RepID=UPI0022FDF9EA|nr:NAD(P)-binding protein [Aspergillus affinis]KAI9037090.1 NAD(P)-binding protein [Aspergillus affinis]
MDNSVKLTGFTALAAAVVVFLNLLADDHPKSTASESGNESDRILIGKTIEALQRLSEGQSQSLCGQGLPQGYITHLESRLASTEQALFAVYEHLRSLGLHTEIPEGLGEQQPSRSQTRVAKMAEWERLPLNARGDLERWWAERRGGVVGYSDGWVGDAARAQTVVLGMGSREDGGVQEEVREREGKAEELARGEAGVYF